MPINRFLRVLIFFIGWLFFLNFSYTYSLLSALLSHKQISTPISFNIYIEYVILVLVSMNVSFFPFAGLIATAHAYISEILKKRFNKNHNDNNSLSLSQFLFPAILLSSLLFAFSLYLTLFVIHDANHRVANILCYFTTGKMSYPDYRSDREMSIGQLLNDADKCKIAQITVENNNKINSKSKRYRDSLMVEVYKKFSFPFLAFLCPLLGLMLAIIFSKFKFGKRIAFYVIPLYIAYVILASIIWSLLALGERLGDQGKLQPIISMSLAPGFVLILILAMSKTCYNMISLNCKSDSYDCVA